MGRPQILSDREWDEVGRRYANGEGARPLAREYDISEAAIRKRFSALRTEIQDAAQSLASSELRVERMCVSAQGVVRSLADQLKGIQNHYAKAAEAQAEAGAIISAKMLGQAKALPDSPEAEDLKPIMAGAETVKSLLSPATNLISNKTKDLQDQEDKAGKFNVNVSFPEVKK